MRIDPRRFPARVDDPRALELRAPSTRRHRQLGALRSERSDVV